MGGLRWMRRSVAKLAAQLTADGFAISPSTVRRWLKRNGFSLRVNRKCLATTQHPDRDPQFQRIAALLAEYAGCPVISVDTKKKELVGLFRNAGATWQKAAIKVNDHDFRSLADGLAVPYGIYDVQANLGTVCVGDSADTPAFAVDCIEIWWRTEGRFRYPGATTLLILADSGGSNGCRPRAWKHALQHVLCNPHGLRVRVAHYPSGCSKWNPIEHRLFSFLSTNWQGKPLDSFETILNYIRTTTTLLGLAVTAHRITRQYARGVRISDGKMAALNLHPDAARPRWNYEIRPHGTDCPEPPPAAGSGALAKVPAKPKPTTG